MSIYFSEPGLVKIIEQYAPPTHYIKTQHFIVAVNANTMIGTPIGKISVLGPIQHFGGDKIYIGPSINLLAYFNIETRKVVKLDHTWPDKILSHKNTIVVLCNSYISTYDCESDKLIHRINIENQKNTNMIIHQDLLYYSGDDKTKVYDISSIPYSQVQFYPYTGKILCLHNDKLYYYGKLNHGMGNHIIVRDAKTFQILGSFNNGVDKLVSLHCYKDTMIIHDYKEGRSQGYYWRYYYLKEFNINTFKRGKVLVTFKEIQDVVLVQNELQYYSRHSKSNGFNIFNLDTKINKSYHSQYIAFKQLQNFHSLVSVN